MAIELPHTLRQVCPVFSGSSERAFRSMRRQSLKPSTEYSETHNKKKEYNNDQ